MERVSAQIVHDSLHTEPLARTAFATFADFPADKVTWSGSSRVEKKSAVAIRAFCSVCYSPLSMIYDDEPDTVGIVAALIDESSLEKPLPKLEAHIFVASKPSWHEIQDGARQNATWSAGWMDKHPWSR